MTENWLKKHQTAVKELKDISLRLKHISNAFCVTGNTAIGSNLFDMASSIEKCQEDMENAVSISINEQHQTAEQNSINVLKATLSGIEIAKVQQKWDFNAK